MQFNKRMSRCSRYIRNIGDISTWSIVFKNLLSKSSSIKTPQLSNNLAIDPNQPVR